MDRFEELYEDHNNAEFKTYEMITMNKEIWLWRWIGPLMFLSGLNQAKKSITDKDVLDKHSLEMDSKYINIQIDWRKTKPENDEKARNFLKKVAGWLNEDNK